VIQSEKQNQALHALHHVLIRTRTLAYQGCDPAHIADILDWAELLPRCIAAEKDQTAEFRNALEAIAEREPTLDVALTIFDQPEPARRW